MQRQRGALHRHPAAVHRHRERRVDQQRDRGLGARLGLDDLDVARSSSRTPCARVAALAGACGRTALVTVRGDVPRLGVAERPLPGGAAAARRPRRPWRMSRCALAAGHPVGDVAQQRLAELAHRLGRQPQLPVGGALEVAGVAQRPLQLGQRRGRRRRPRRRAGGPARRGRRRPSARRGRTATSCSARSSRSARSCSTPVPSPSPRPCSPPNCSEPPQSSPGRSARRLSSSRSSDCISSGEPNACCGERRQLVALLGRHRVAASAGRRRPAAASASISSSMFCGFSGKKSPCLSMKSSNCSVGVLAAAVLLEQLVEVVEHLVDRAARSSSVAFSSACFMPAKRWSSSSRPSRSLIFS